MPTARFTGRVLPTGVNTSIPNQPTFRWKADELGLDMTFRVHIQDSAIRIDCDLNKFEDTYLVPLFMRAYDIARACVDLAAFATGNGLTVIVEEFTDPTGATTRLAPQHPSLAALATAAKMDTQDFDKILRIVLAEPRLFMALQDLIEAIRLPQRAAINCARAIRILRGFFRRSGSSPESAWLALRENLQISKSYVQRITQPSRGSTPAPDAYVPGEVTNDAICRSWIMMNRLFEYLKREGQPLPLSEFPLLV